MNKLTSVFLFLTTIIHYQTIAQDSAVVRDFETWNGITLKTSFLDKKLDIQWTNEIRLMNNSTARDIFFTELDLSYEPFKNFKVGSAFRYINETENVGANQYRYQFDVGYSHKPIKRFELGYRMRYQHRDYFENGAGDNDFATTKYRLRLKAAYNINNWKFDPYFSAEIFYASTTANAIQYIDEVPTGTVDLEGFEKLRFTIGTEFKVFKDAELGVFYRLEKELSGFPTYYSSTNPLPKTTHITGINFKYTIDKEKKK